MPELPEVETIKRSLEPQIVGCRITQITASTSRLRWTLSESDRTAVVTQQIVSLVRRAKYLVFSLSQGDLVAHLGMSGYLALQATPLVKPHVHLSLYLDCNQVLSYCDPRRFGGWQWVPGGVHNTPMFEQLGPEPLSDQLDVEQLLQRMSRSQQAIKIWLMNQANLVGVGNIYANEALFATKIHPETPASMLSRAVVVQLIKNLQIILLQAIETGGTSLKDFQSTDGQLGYFSQKLQVYNREGLPCYHCHSKIVRWQLGQRSTFACMTCQNERSC